MEKKEINQLMKIMFNMQLQYNNKYNGEEWISNITREGREIDFETCIITEMMELLDSIQWKHWTDTLTKTDMDNVKVEVVDIWHFILGMLIQKIHKTIPSEEYYNIVYSYENTVKYGQELGCVCYDKRKPEKGIDELRALVKRFLKERVTLDTIMPSFLAIMEVLKVKFDFGWQELFDLYSGKSALNRLRQDNGYLESLYTKQWDGYEDNFHMFKMVKHNNVPFIDDFREFNTSKIEYYHTLLSKRYETILDMDTSYDNIINKGQ